MEKIISIEKINHAVMTGTPEEVAKVKESYTGQYLKPVLERDTKLTKEAKK